MKKISVLVTLVVLSLVQVTALADEGQEQSMDELSKSIANPLEQVWNLAFQHNYMRLSGDLIDGDEHINATLFQPVLPLPVGDRYAFLARQ